MGLFRIVPKNPFFGTEKSEKKRKNKKNELEKGMGSGGENVATARCYFIRYENYICPTELRE